ncbi:MAG: peptidylprolyl isomerase [Pseudoruegeria sp.]
MSKIFKDPAFHFALLSVLLFGLFYLSPRETGPVVTERDFVIAIDQATARNLADQFKATWRRYPTETEFNALINSAVDDEIRVREAIALGLDKNDSAIRARLAQKMQFLADSAAQSLQPIDATLEQHLLENGERFETPAKMSIEQIYLGDRPDQEVIEKNLTALNAGTLAQELGVRSMLPGTINNAYSAQLDAQFGKGFAQQLIDPPLDTWFVASSGLGVHVIRVSDRQKKHLPQLDEIREKVLTDWRLSQTAILAKAQLEAMKVPYEITLPSSEERLEVLKP